MYGSTMNCRGLGTSTSTLVLPRRGGCSLSVYVSVRDVGCQSDRVRGLG